jgi:hypothetical protein
MSITTITALFARRVTSRGWIGVPVEACTPRIALMHTSCGHRSPESWEFSEDPRDYGRDPVVRDYYREHRRRMRRIARDYATAHTCTDLRRSV